jgi:hypothetical protein
MSVLGDWPDVIDWDDVVLVGDLAQPVVTVAAGRSLSAKAMLQQTSRVGDNSALL